MDEKKELEELQKQLESDIAKGVSDKEVGKKIRDHIAKLLQYTIPGMMDNEDYAYIMLNGYVNANNCKLVDDKILDQDDNVVATVGHCSYDGDKLSVELKYEKPIHCILVKITLDEIRKDKR